jgi:hypothetical protein
MLPFRHASPGSFPMPLSAGALPPGISLAAKMGGREAECPLQMRQSEGGHGHQTSRTIQIMAIRIITPNQAMNGLKFP